MLDVDGPALVSVPIRSTMRHSLTAAMGQARTGQPLQSCCARLMPLAFSGFVPRPTASGATASVVPPPDPISLPGLHPGHPAVQPIGGSAPCSMLHAPCWGGLHPSPGPSSLLSPRLGKFQIDVAVRHSATQRDSETLDASGCLQPGRIGQRIYTACHMAWPGGAWRGLAWHSMAESGQQLVSDGCLLHLATLCPTQPRRESEPFRSGVVLCSGAAQFTSRDRESRWPGLPVSQSPAPCLDTQKYRLVDEMPRLALQKQYIIYFLEAPFRGGNKGKPGVPDPGRRVRPFSLSSGEPPPPSAGAPPRPLRRGNSVTVGPFFSLSHARHQAPTAFDNHGQGSAATSFLLRRACVRCRLPQP